LDKVFTSLGWTEALWTCAATSGCGAGVFPDVLTVPAAYTKAWSNLTRQERCAACRVCYVEHTWNDEQHLQSYWGLYLPPNVTNCEHLYCNDYEDNGGDEEELELELEKLDDEKGSDSSSAAACDNINFIGYYHLRFALATALLVA